MTSTKKKVRFQMMISIQSKNKEICHLGLVKNIKHLYPPFLGYKGAIQRNSRFKNYPIPLLKKLKALKTNQLVVFLLIGDKKILLSI
jgi:hypothetical protein